MNDTTRTPRSTLACHSLSTRSAVGRYRRYVVGDLLGAGGRASVFSTRDASLREPSPDLAIKLYRRDSAREREEDAPRSPPAAHARSPREALIQASLAHPGIAAIHDAGHTSAPLVMGALRFETHTPYLVTERLGASLDVAPPDTFEALRDDLLVILDALAHAHARGVIHCDLKPANLLRGPDDRPRIVDFGGAWLREARLVDRERLDKTAGTPAFMAPEQFTEHAELVAATDLYALGCVAWQLATGAPPFGFGSDQTLTGLMRCHLYSQPGPFRPRFEVAEGFASWLSSLLQKRASDRPRSASQAGAMLGALDPLTSAGAPFTSPPPRASRPDDVTIDAPPVIAFERHQASASPTPDRRSFPLEWRPAHPAPLIPPPSFRLLPWLVPTTGREAERDILWGALAQVGREATPHLVQLAGPSGIGRSTLAQWLIHRGSELGVSVPVGRSVGTDPAARADLFVSIASHLRADHDPPELIHRRLSALFGDDGQASANAILHIIDPDRRHGLALDRARVHSAQERTRLFAAFVRALTLAPGGSGPVAILWLDDLAPSDPSVSAVEALLQVSPLPLLIVATTASSEPLFARGVSLLSLGPLSDADHTALASGLGLSPSAVHRDDGPLAVVHAALGPPPPEGTPRPDRRQLLRGRLAAAIEPLAAEHREVIELAATYGAEIPGAVWSAICAAAFVYQPEFALGPLVGAGLAHYLDRGWAFTHAEVHAAMRESMVDSGTAHDRHATLAELLGRLERAPWPVRLRRARIAASVAPEVAKVDLLSVANELIVSSRWDEARAILSEHERIPGGEGDVAAALALADIERLNWRFDAAAESLRAAEASASETAEHAEVALAKAILSFWVGDCVAAEESLSRATDLFEAEKDQAGLDRCALEAASIAGALGDVETALRAAEHAAQAFAAHPWLRARSLEALGQSLRRRREHAASLSCLERARDAYTDSGDRSGAASALLGVADALRYTMRVDEAMDRYREAGAVWQELGSPDAALSDIGLAYGHIARGDLVLARGMLDELRCRLAEQGQKSFMVYVLAGLLRCSARRDAREFDALLDELEASMDETAFVDPDLTWLFTETLSAIDRDGVEAWGVSGAEATRPSERPSRLERLLVRVGEGTRNVSKIERILWRLPARAGSGSRPRPIRS